MDATDQEPAEVTAENGPAERSWKTRARHFWREWIKPLVVIVAVCGTFRAAVADWNVVPTGSMKPTIVEGDRIFVNKLAYGLRVPLVGWRVLDWSEPARGDVVVLFAPDSGIRLVKRVVGLPGDVIQTVGGRLIVNGQFAEYAPPPSELLEALDPEERRQYAVALEDTEDAVHPVMLVNGSNHRDFGPLKVPPDHYFLMGDNRDESRDSREFGSAHRDLIVGRAQRIILSLDAENHYLPRTDRFLEALP